MEEIMKQLDDEALRMQNEGADADANLLWAAVALIQYVGKALDDADKLAHEVEHGAAFGSDDEMELRRLAKEYRESGFRARNPPRFFSA
ncbi:hypothetical protein [Mangrovicoccus sp. HB161399]|uniref:hypothetical protein n=1 Tax=Mangrovicoccus sp. HB161399 TaxID=2720392 RepID=UPI0015525E02|nr:hypothetical protein [Mangrovicoccus sp. HB161399]